MTVVVVLDLDDTLYLERDYVSSGLAVVSRTVEAELGAAGFAEVAGRRFADSRRAKLFDATLVELGLHPDAALVRRLVETYRAHVPDIRLASDALAFLRRGHDGPLALITDGYCVAQRNKVRALGLETMALDPIICTDAWGRDYWKPHPRAFELVQARHGRPGRHFVYVADNPAKDFVAPRALGWGTIQIDRPGAVHGRAAPGERHRADRIVTSFDELTADSIEAIASGAEMPAAS